MNIYEKIMNIRNDFLHENIKKSGVNKYTKKNYLQLADFIAPAVELSLRYKLYTHIDVGVIENDKKYAIMTVINMEDICEQVQYKLIVPDFSQQKEYGQMIQDSGKLETYVRRYLYLLFLDLAVPDELDKNFKPASQKQMTRKKDNNYKSFNKGYEEQVMQDRHVPRTNEVKVDDPEPLQTIYNKLVVELESEDSEVTQSNLRVKASALKRDGKIDSKTLKGLVDLINSVDLE